jgi:hypothetical protein
MACNYDVMIILYHVPPSTDVWRKQDNDLSHFGAPNTPPTNCIRYTLEIFSTQVTLII